MFTLAIFITFATVPSVRAAALQVLREIAGFSFLETNDPFDIPLEDGEDVHSFIIESTVVLGEDKPESGGLIIGHSGGTYSASQISQKELEEKNNVLIKKLDVPPGYQTDGPSFYDIPDSESAGESGWLGMQAWFNPSTEDLIFLVIHPENKNLITVIGPNSAQEVIVNNQPGALLKGIWSGNPEDEEAAWDPTRGHTLTWRDGGVTYEMSSPTLDANTLIQLAESMD